MEDNRPQRLVAGADDQGCRLDTFLASYLEDLSRSKIQQYIKAGRVLVGGRQRPASYTIKSGDIIEWSLPSPEPGDFKVVPEDIPVPITYLDEDIVVVNKPPGLVVHPAHGNWQGTLVNALAGRGIRLASNGGPYRPGIVHRLDKDTSGLMVVARNDRAYGHLTEQIKARSFEKTYHAIAWGNLGPRPLTVDAPIGRHPVQRKKMTVPKSGGREAVSNFFVVDNFKQFTYIRITTSTGRTHQIRVHLSHIHHPVLGDPVYGGRKRKGTGADAASKRVRERLLKIMKRHALHASKLAFTHPSSGHRLEFLTALPDDMLQAIETLYTADWFKEAED